MKTLIFIGLGSGIGGIIRYLCSTFVQSKHNGQFPLGTFLVNIIGCFFIGLLYTYFEKNNIAKDTRLMLITGLLGGFTTFSAFSLENLNLIKNGQIITGFYYIILSVFLGLLATYFGAVLAK